MNPGTYTVKLTVNGKTYSQPITVKQDPRVKTPALVMQQVYALTKATYYGAIDAQDAARQAQGLRDQIAALDAEADGRGRGRARGVRQEGAGADRRRAGRRRWWPRRRRGGAGGGGRGGGAARWRRAAAARPQAGATPPVAAAGAAGGRGACSPARRRSRSAARAARSPAS